MNADELRMDRRRFLGGAAGLAGAAALASWAPRALSKPGGPNAPIVFKETLVAQHFSVRDATTRVPSTSASPVMGYLGGPNFPEDPTDLGPLVPLPGGYQEVFNFLGECGYGGFEFFQLSPERGSNPGGANPSVAQIRGVAGLGRHQVRRHPPGRPRHVQRRDRPARPRPAQTQVANADTLGHRMIGTAGDPSGANTHRRLADRVRQLQQASASCCWTTTGSRRTCIPSRTTGSSSPIRRSRSPSARTGSTSSWRTRTRGTCSSSPTSSTCTTPVGASRTSTARCGTRSPTCRRTGSGSSAGTSRTRSAPPSRSAPPGNPCEQTKIRPGFPLNGGMDVIYSTEGHLGNGAASAAQPGYRADDLRLRPRRHGAVGVARPGPAGVGLPARVHGDHGQPREGLQVPHRGVRLGSRPAPPTRAVRCVTPRSAPSCCSG